MSYPCPFKSKTKLENKQVKKIPVVYTHFAHIVCITTLSKDDIVLYQPDEKLLAFLASVMARCLHFKAPVRGQINKAK
jgi:hypothetical protein